jgi:Lon protease-like protein
MPASLPLFPLNTVLFPDGRLALRIFEPRYVDMVRRCLKESSGFGVVLIREGVEAGGPARTFDVGTAARIIDFDQLERGLLGITAVGERRFRVVEREVQKDGLNSGTVDWLPEQAPAAPLGDFTPYAHLLEHLLPELGELYAGVPTRFDDASWVVARLMEILPLPLPDKQLCLELDDPGRRLDLLRSIVKITARPEGSGDPGPASLSLRTRR